MSAELDRLIQEKRSQLRNAFAAYQKAREAVAHAQGKLPGIASEGLTDAHAEIQRLESQERFAANRFNAISNELARFHRGKYGEWHFTWGGPRPSR